jgi:hypothetical protein
VSLRRLGLAGCVFLVAVGASVSAASAAPPAATGKSVTFHLVEKQIGGNFIDNPPRQGMNAAPLIGDQFVFTSDLETRSGARAGSLDVTCTVARGGMRSQAPCYGVYLLKGGQLMAMAVASFFGNAPTHVVIVGGTGVYQGVTGSVVSVSRGQNSDLTDDTMNIIWK